MKDIKSKSRSISDLQTPKSNFLNKFRKEQTNEIWLKHSQNIAIKLHTYLRKNKLQQKDFAKLMEVSPQQISKILSGKENLKLETISKIEKLTGLNIITKDIKEPVEIQLNELISALSKIELSFKEEDFQLYSKKRESFYLEIKNLAKLSYKTKDTLQNYTLYKFD
jgi:transcriptional regulator with XRE-family HTH domain